MVYGAILLNLNGRDTVFLRALIIIAVFAAGAGAKWLATPSFDEQLREIVMTEGVIKSFPTEQGFTAAYFLVDRYRVEEAWYALRFYGDPRPRNEWLF